MDSGEHSGAQLTLVHQNVFIIMSQNFTWPRGDRTHQDGPTDGWDLRKWRQKQVSPRYHRGSLEKADSQESSHQSDWNAEDTVTFSSSVLMFRFLSNCTVVPTQQAELIIYYESFSNEPTGLANGTFPSPQLRLEDHNSTLSSNLPSFHSKKKNSFY